MTVRTRRLIAVSAAVAALGASASASAPAALAADHTQHLEIAAELIRQPAGKPWIVNLTIGAQLGMSDGTAPEPVNRMVFSFTKGAKVHPEAFGSCTMATLKDKGPDGCPQSSRLGSGKAIAHVLEQDYPATIDVLNGPAAGKDRKLYIYARALGTVVIRLEGTLKKTRGKYGYVLDVPIAPIQIVGDMYASITSFEVTVGGIGRKKVPFIEAPTSCAKPGWPFFGSFTYADGAGGTSSATITCLLKATSDD
jgi:hypothetical protein